MKQDEYKDFEELMKAAAGAIGRPAPEAGALMLSFDALRKYRFEQVREAVMAHLAGPDGRYMPTPSHIVERIEGKPDDRAALAWALVERVLMSNAGTRESVRFPTPEYHWAIVQLGGWLALGDKYEDGDARDAAFMVKHF